MLIARTLQELHSARTRLGDGIALVPTMGALHAGHLALLAAAQASGARVAASIFVNPLQFGPHEDLDLYPRDEAGDLAKLEASGCDLAWLPDTAVMYPSGTATLITVNGPAEGLEGAMRPGHFAGVATVVAKLFGQIQPRAAYFGEKDWQQVQVITRMVADLAIPVRIRQVATVREADGLALSSRNRFLSPAERAAAPGFFAALKIAAHEIASGREVAASLDSATERLGQAGMVQDYLCLVQAQNLTPLTVWREPARLVAAVRLGRVRLLDNVAIG